MSEIGQKLDRKLVLMEKVEKEKGKVAEVVREILENYPYMKDFLLMDVVNHSALARMVEPELRRRHKGKITKDAVIVAIKRYARGLEKKSISKKLIELFASSDLTLKSDIVYMILQKNIPVFKKLEGLYSEIAWDKGEILFVLQGRGDILVVIDERNMDKLRKVVDEREIEKVFDNSAVIIMYSPLETGETPGFISHVTTLLGNQGINMEFLSMGRDSIFLLSERDATRAFGILKKCIMESRSLMKAGA